MSNTSDLKVVRGVLDKVLRFLFSDKMSLMYDLRVPKIFSISLDDWVLFLELLARNQKSAEFYMIAGKVFRLKELLDDLAGVVKKDYILNWLTTPNDVFKK